MVPGFNSSVSHAGIEYHVQTEDLGHQAPFVLTLVYRGGAIVAREKVNYRDVLGEGASAAQIRSLLEQQHQRILRGVQTGQLPGLDPSGMASSSAPPPPSRPSPSAPTATEELVDRLIAEYLRARRTGRTP